MKRKLVTFGFCNKDVRTGVNLVDPTMQEIYNKLKLHGFRETGWQYVYENQLAGLVLPYKNGINEVHIRFYPDRCFAELEIGRALISHFFGPQYNAAELIKQITKDCLTEMEWVYLSRLLNSPLKVDEEQLEAWRPEYKVDPYAKTIRNNLNHRGLMKRLFAGLGWQNIAYIILPATSVILMIPTFEISWGIIGAISILSGSLLPSIGRP